MTDTPGHSWSAPLTTLDGFYDLDSRLEQPFRSLPRPDGRLHAVVGGAKMGKTSVLNALCHWLPSDRARSGRPLAPALVDYHPEAGDLLDARSFLLCLVRNLREGLRRLGLCTISEDSFASFFGGKSAAEGFRAALHYLLHQVAQVSAEGGQSLGEVRLIGLIDDAEEIACLPWAPEFFGVLRDLYNCEKVVSSQLDLVLSGESRLARYFESGQLWEGGDLIALQPLSHGAVSGWLCDISGGALASPLTQAVADESGGQPYLLRYLVDELASQAERRHGWDRLPADQVDRLASGFLQHHRTMLDRCKLGIQRADPRGIAWAACRMVVDSGPAGLDAVEIDDRLWHELGEQADVDQIMSELTWRGAVCPLPHAPERFAATGLFRRYCRLPEPEDRPSPGEPEPAIWPVPAPRLAPELAYHQFEIRISGAPGTYTVSARSLAGEASGDFRNPVPPGQRESMWMLLTRRAGEATDVEEMGQRLFDALFDGEVRELFRAASALADRDPSGAGLRIKLVLIPPELHSLPWEFLYDGEIKDFVALYKKTPLVRYVEQLVAVPRFRPVDKLRLLIVVSSPANFAPLDVVGEIDIIRTALEPWRLQGWLEYDVVRGREATARDLGELLRAKEYHVFHFLGHGALEPDTGEGMLLLEGADGLSDPLRADQLARLLGDEREIRLVFLNACQTAAASESAPFSSVAGRLVRIGVPAVVATLYPISDPAATSFAREFYQALAHRYPVEAAVAEGRKQIDISVGNYEWGVPILYLRAQHGYIF
jgi:hypothetical protein